MLGKSDRSRQELSNEYLLARFGFDPAENEPFNFHNFSSLQGVNFHRAVVSVKVVRALKNGPRADGQPVLGPDSEQRVLSVPITIGCALI